ncbi:hypothetical protein D3C80_1467350 [compost metagenome]
MRQADAGIAGGAFHHGTARSQPTTAFGVFDDAQGRAIFHRTAGVEELGLGQDLATGLGTQLAQTNQRRIANGSAKTVADSHGSPPTCSILFLV